LFPPHARITASCHTCFEARLLRTIARADGRSPHVCGFERGESVQQNHRANGPDIAGLCSHSSRSRVVCDEGAVSHHPPPGHTAFVLFLVDQPFIPPGHEFENGIPGCTTRAPPRGIFCLSRGFFEFSTGTVARVGRGPASGASSGSPGIEPGARVIAFAAMLSTAPLGPCPICLLWPGGWVRLQEKKDGG
jgi:hypothetical protein